MIERLLLFSFLGRYIARWKWKVFTSLAALAVVSLTSLIYPWLIKLMVDSLTGGLAVPAELGWIVGSLVLLFALSTLLGYRQQLTMHSLGYRLRNDLREDLFAVLLDRPLAFHRSQQVGELSARATEDISKVQPVFVSLVAPVFQNVLIIGGGLVISLYLNWVAALVLLLFMLLPLPLVLRYSRSIRSLGSESQARHAQANAYLDETLVGIRDIKAFTQEEAARGRYVSLLAQAFDAEIAASRMVIRGNQSAYFLLSVTLLAMLYLAAVSAIPGWTIGSMVAFYFYAHTMVTAMLSVGRIYLTFQSVSGALGRVRSLLHPGGDTEDRTDGRSAMDTGSIAFDECTFGYDARSPVLRDLTFALRHGSWTVIGGPSGSGKSTIANLIMGFYRPDKGRVLVDGEDTSRWNMKSLRQHIGYVGQDPVLFHGTLLENLLVPNGIRSSTLEDYLHITCLDEVVRCLPQGMDTLVGERGYTLSGGQKARVAIARALLRNPVILILDEATAMLESDLEQRLWSRLAGSRKDRTTLILSHHPANIPHVYTYLAIEQTDRGTRMNSEP